MANLTKAQMRVLASVGRGDVESMGFGESYFEDGANVTAVATRLKADGLIENGEYHGGGNYDVGVTAAGRAELGITETEED